MSDIILYDYWRSSASYRVRIALNLAGLDYKTIPVDLLNKDHKSKEHLLRNPQGLVPVLEIDGEQLSQSLAILDYLDFRNDLHLYPKDPKQKAKVTALAHTIAIDIHPICNLGVVGHVAGLLPDHETIRQDWMKQFIRPGLLAFEAQLQTMKLTPLLNGDRPGIAEICLMPQIYNADRWQVDYRDCKMIAELCDQCAKLPAFINAHPDVVNPK